MDAVSRDVVRAILEARDHRHNETHAVLLTMFQSLVAELVEQNALAAAPLAERLQRHAGQIEPDPHGAAAHGMLAHVIDWLRTIEPGLPPSHPVRWFAPKMPDADGSA